MCSSGTFVLLCSDVSKIGLTNLAESDKHSDMPRDANKLVKINGRNTVRNFNSVVRYCTDVSESRLT